MVPISCPTVVARRGTPARSRPVRHEETLERVHDVCRLPADRLEQDCVERACRAAGSDGERMPVRGQGGHDGGTVALDASVAVARARLDHPTRAPIGTTAGLADAGAACQRDDAVLGAEHAMTADPEDLTQVDVEGGLPGSPGSGADVNWTCSTRATRGDDAST